MEVVFQSKRNVFLNEFSIPASENRLSVKLTQYSFIQRLFPVCGNRKIQFLENNLFPANRNRFSWRRYSFIQFFFLETIIAIRGRPKLLKHLVPARSNRFFFFQALIRIEVAFRSSEIAFFGKSFDLACGNGFLINYKLYAFIRSFSLLVDIILEISSKPIFFHIFYS